MNNGWIKLHRRIADNVFLNKDNNAFLVFARLLILVNAKGQWAGGRRQLSEKVNLNERTLYDVLKRLQKEQIINIKTNSKYSIISICKWTAYQQEPNRTANHKPTTSQPQANTLTRIENKEKENAEPAFGAGRRKAKEMAEAIKNRHLSANVV